MTLSRFAAVAAMGLVCIAGQASAAQSAAQLSAVKGSVMVAQNGAFAPASNMALRAGDRVVAAADGQAQVRFADGCVVTLAPQAMATISDKSPCAAGGLVKSSAPMQGWMDNGLVPAFGIFVLGALGVYAIGEAFDDGIQSP